MSLINLPGARNGTTHIIHSHILLSRAWFSLSSCLQLTLDVLQFGFVQHTVARPACPKCLTFRLWVPMGSLLSFEERALALREAS